MATAWGEVCRQCVSTLAEVPIQILLVTIAATFLGLFVLVSTGHLSLRPACTSARAVQYPFQTRPRQTTPEQSQLQLQIVNVALQPTSSPSSYSSSRHPHASPSQKKRSIEP